MTTYDFISSNKRKSVLLIFIFTVLVLAVGGLVDYMYDGGGFFLVIAAGYSIVSGLVGFYSGDKEAEGSCGGDKEAGDKDAEGKCGEGKCGGSKSN